MPLTRKSLYLAGLLLVLIVLAVAYYYFKVRPREWKEDTGSGAGQIPAPMAADALPPVDQGPSDWPCWRGKDQNRSVTIQGLKTDWSEGLSLKWGVDYLCQGDDASTWSAPSIQGNRLVVPGRDKGKDLIFCLHSKTGELLWMGSYDAKAANEYGPGPRSTPCILA